MSDFKEYYKSSEWFGTYESDLMMRDAYIAGAQSQQTKIDELQARINVYELHINTLKNIHECDFNEQSESSYILGNLDGFFECIESDLKGNKYD